MKAKKGKTIGKRVAVLLGTAVIAVGLTYPAAAKSNEVVAEENTEKISIETSKLTDVETLLSLAKVREETPAEEITLQANDNWMNEAMANFTGEQDVRKEAKADSEVVGKIYENTKVTVLEHGTEWSHIKSGNVDGFIESAKLAFGKSGELLMKAKCQEIATLKQESQLFSETNVEAETETLVNAGDQFVIVEKTAEWDKVKTAEDATAYLPTAILDTQYQTRDGKTLEEIAAEEQAKKDAEEQAKKEAEEKAKAEAAKAEEEKKVAEEAAAAAQSAQEAVAEANKQAQAVSQQKVQQTTVTATPKVQVQTGNSSGLTKRSGVNYYGGRRETYYSSRVLHHYLTETWILDGEGFYHDPNTGAYVVAASDLPEGTMFEGSKGTCIVLDSGCDPGTTDYYVNW